MNWENYIESNPNILAGKPVVKGTRLSVEFILGLYAVGWTQEQILANYPTLNSQSLQAVFNFTADCMKEQNFYSFSLSNKAS
jgi:uncharacterized protein (DUF433 family)